VKEVGQAMTEINYQLRLAAKTDYPFCHDLTKQNMLTLFSRHWGGWVDSVFHNDFQAEEATIIQVDGQDVGYFSLKETKTELYLSNMQLSSATQGQGLGSSIMESILANTSKQMRLTTFSDNPAMRLYERLGFEVAERDGETVYMLKR